MSLTRSFVVRGVGQSETRRKRRPWFIASVEQKWRTKLKLEIIFRGQFQRFRTSFDLLCYTEKVLPKLLFTAVHTTLEFQLKHSRCNNGFSAGLLTRGRLLEAWLALTTGWSGFQMTVEKPKPKQLLQLITTGAGSAMSQSQFLAINCNSLEAWEKSRVHCASGFGFDSHWFKNWRESWSQSLSVAIAITYSYYFRQSFEKNCSKKYQNLCVSMVVNAG